MHVNLRLLHQSRGRALLSLWPCFDIQPPELPPISKDHHFPFSPSSSAHGSSRSSSNPHSNDQNPFCPESTIAPPTLNTSDLLTQIYISRSHTYPSPNCSPRQEARERITQPQILSASFVRLILPGAFHAYSIIVVRDCCANRSYS